jgi:hypothetical protein
MDKAELRGCLKSRYDGREGSGMMVERDSEVKAVPWGRRRRDTPVT